MVLSHSDIAYHRNWAYIVNANKPGSILLQIERGKLDYYSMSSRLVLYTILSSFSPSFTSFSYPLFPPPFSSSQGCFLHTSRSWPLRSFFIFTPYNESIVLKTEISMKKKKIILNYCKIWTRENIKKKPIPAQV